MRYARPGEGKWCRPETLDTQANLHKHQHCHLHAHVATGDMLDHQIHTLGTAQYMKQLEKAQKTGESVRKAELCCTLQVAQHQIYSKHSILTVKPNSHAKLESIALDFNRQTACALELS